MNDSLEELARSAQEGSPAALEHLVEQIQDKIYGLALRMLWHPEDARDATQEILIRIITHLASFRGESRFLTWAYRVASNYLLSARKSRLEEQSYTFERFGQELDEGLADTPVESGMDESLLMEEIKIGCTLGMLLCLDRPHRLAYILGEILDIDSREAAEIVEVAPATFRKRLSRARAEIISFMKMKCGLVNSANGCRCSRRVNYALQKKRINPEGLLFAKDADEARRFPEVLREIRKLEEMRRSVAIYQSHPQFAAPRSFASFVRDLLDSTSPQ